MQRDWDISMADEEDDDDEQPGSEQPTVETSIQDILNSTQAARAFIVSALTPDQRCLLSNLVGARKPIIRLLAASVYLGLACTI